MEGNLLQNVNKAGILDSSVLLMISLISSTNDSLGKSLAVSVITSIASLVMPNFFNNFNRVLDSSLSFSMLHILRIPRSIFSDDFVLIILAHRYLKPFSPSSIFPPSSRLRTCETPSSMLDRHLIAREQSVLHNNRTFFLYHLSLVDPSFPLGPEQPSPRSSVPQNSSSESFSFLLLTFPVNILRFGKFVISFRGLMSKLRFLQSDFVVRETKSSMSYDLSFSSISQS